MLKDCGFARERNNRHGYSVQFLLTPFQNSVRTQGLDGVESEKVQVAGMKKSTLLAH